jgi:hypothetical protein
MLFLMANDKQTKIATILGLVDEHRDTRHYRRANDIKTQILENLEDLANNGLVEFEVEIGADETQD